MNIFMLVMASVFSCSGPESSFTKKSPVANNERILAESQEQKEENTKDPYFERAKEFDRFLTKDLSDMEQKGLEDFCRKTPHENIFCFSIVNYEYFEEKAKTREVVKSAPIRKGPKIAPKFSSKGIKNWVALRTAPVSSTLGSISSLNPQKLARVKEQALKEDSCPNHASISVAAVLEDQLPKPELIAEIARLYHKGGACIVSNVSDKVTMLTRSGLFYFAAKDFSNAKSLFLEASTIPQTFTARAIYWLYRTQLQIKEEKEAAVTLDKLKENYPFAFHTLVALTAKDVDPGEELLKKKSNTVRRSEQLPLINPLIEQVEILQRLGFEKSASKVLDWAVAESHGTEPEVKIYLAGLKEEQGDYYSKIFILSDVLYNHPSLVSKETMEMYFPKVFFPVFEKQSKVVDPYLLLSIARRESAFNPKAVSSSNARGLLQILPAVKDSLIKEKNLFNPEDNVEVGAVYVTKLLSELNGQIHYALAAYNAGPHRLKAWMERYPTEDPILFVDLIPYRETREYVASVLRNYYWYRRIHQSEHAISPRQLLEFAIAKGG